MSEWLSGLCERIKMPGEVTKKVLGLAEGKLHETVKSSAAKLRMKETWQEGLDELKKNLGDDPEGLKLLTVMLMEGEHTYEGYRSKGISDRIFYDTFSCFSRFVHEHMTGYGYYGFDRGFWVVRQLSMLLFRICTLEFEFAMYKDERVISVHIPSDANITPENCEESYDKSRAFIHTCFPTYENDRYFCDSWLLAPGLKEVLKENSNIIQFQNRYSIVETDPQAKDYMEWVFRKKEGSLEEVPQNTSLQIRMKEYLLKGGIIGIASGFLK